MAFTVLPAVDVAGGRVARVQPDRAVPAGGTLADPLAVALGLQAEGAEWIHLVDLDAAFGRGSNADLLAGVVSALDIDVGLAGGVHDDASLDRALASGCTRVNVGTLALRDLDWCARALAAHGDRMAICLDVRPAPDSAGSPRYRLAARGGPTDGGDLWEAVAALDRAGCARYVVTDVGRDGQLNGPNLDLYRSVAGATSAGVIASGGVSSIEDLVAVAEAATTAPNLEGAIVGTALHAGRFTLPEALAAIRRAS